MDYGYVSPFLSLFLTSLLIISLLLVGLAWHDLRVIKQILRDSSIADKAWQEAAKDEREKLAAVLQAKRDTEHLEFLKHTHDDRGKVVI